MNTNVPSPIYGQFSQLVEGGHSLNLQTPQKSPHRKISIDTKPTSPRYSPRSPHSALNSSTSPKTPRTPGGTRVPALSSEELRQRMIEKNMRSPGPKYKPQDLSPTRTASFSQDDRMRYLQHQSCSPGPAKYSPTKVKPQSPSSLGGTFSKAPRVTDFWSLS
ncbi:hypothetical protein P9112_012585 [Eukaryota sp. TZLM1-RC]